MTESGEVYFEGRISWASAMDVQPVTVQAMDGRDYRGVYVTISRVATQARSSSR